MTLHKFHIIRKFISKFKQLQAYKTCPTGLPRLQFVPSAYKWKIIALACGKWKMGNKVVLVEVEVEVEVVSIILASLSRHTCYRSCSLSLLTSLSPSFSHSPALQSETGTLYLRALAALFSYKTNILWHNPTSQRWSCHRICNNNKLAPIQGKNIFNFGNNFRNAIKIISASCSSQIQIYLTTNRRFIFLSMFTCCSCMFAARGKCEVARREKGDGNRGDRCSSSSKKMPS